MTIEILFFGATADAAATRHTEVELVNSSTAGGLIERLIQKYPKLSDHRLLFAVNEEYAGPDTIVSHGDQFALFTPVSGG